MSAGSQDYTTGAGVSHLKDDLIVALRERNDLAAERDALRKDAERLDWLERWIADNSSGFEIFPIGPECEYGSDGNTVVRVLSWSLADKQWPVETLRKAIDAAMGEP